MQLYILYKCIFPEYFNNFNGLIQWAALNNSDPILDLYETVKIWEHVHEYR